MKVCHQCHQLSSEKAKFCDNCGSSLDGAQIQELTYLLIRSQNSKWLTLHQEDTLEEMRHYLNQSSENHQNDLIVAILKKELFEGKVTFSPYKVYNIRSLTWLQENPTLFRLTLPST